MKNTLVRQNICVHVIIIILTVTTREKNVGWNEKRSSYPQLQTPFLYRYICFSFFSKFFPVGIISNAITEFSLK